MFQMDERDTLTGKILANFIEQHELEKVKWNRLKEQFESKPPVLFKDPKDEGKPDNRLVANFGRYLVLNFNGFFIGVPTRVHHAKESVDEKVQDFWRSNDMDDVLDELGKLTSIYGKAYLFVYQDEETKTRVAYVSPFGLFNIYNNHIKPSTIYSIKYEPIENGYEGQIYDDSGWVDFLLEGNELVTVTPTDENGEDAGKLFYGRPPAIEFVENEERQSLIEPIETFINSFNNTLSEKNNDIDYFADAYLAIIGALLDEEGIIKMRDNKLINIPSTGGEKVLINFLEKPNADESQENLLDRLERLIYTLGMVTNTSENQVGGGSQIASGEALKVKQQSMLNMAMSKERKFQSGLKTMFKMFFNIISNVPAKDKDEYIDIEYTWTRNTPKNLTEEIQNASKAEGILSKPSQLSLISTVSNVDAEMDRIAEENKAPLENQYDSQK